jgi:hypothetical protein
VKAGAAVRQPGGSRIVGIVLPVVVLALVILVGAYLVGPLR